uniref:DNA-dependent protein kinase catalytic subunit n=1 Tax=Rhabditophanes sp. KR3021 TaxID=114890 RepID=A0AC35TLA4_9BILA
WHNGQSLGYELFKKAVMSVEAFLGAPAGYGYKLPLFSYTLKYIQQNALDINMLSRKGSMKFFSCVLKEAPYYFVHENFTVFFNLFTYVIRNDFYENYTQNCELARGGMIALFKKRENDCDRPVFGSPQTLNQLMEFIFSENQELSKCGVSVVSEMLCTLTGQPVQLVAQQMYQCMKAKIKSLTFSASTCTIDTYIGTLYGVTEVMNMTKVKCFFDSSIEEHFGPLVDLARQSLSRTESEIQEVWKSRTAASAFADTINDQFNYYPAVRLAETKFLVAVYECLAKKLEPAQLQIDQPAVIYIKELTSSFLRLMMNCNGILREKIAHELLKTRTVLSELGYDLSCLINVNEFRTSCSELFSDYQEFNLEALSKFVCITSIVNSEIVMS